MKPQLQALIVADHIYQDRVSGKMIICGTFTRVIRRQSATPQGGPTPEKKTVRQVEVSGNPYAYLRLTSVRSGTIPLTVRFVDLSDNRVLLEAVINVEPHDPDPLKSYEVAVPLPRLPIEHDGFYSIDVLYDDELLGNWRIEAVTVPLPDDEANDVDN